MNDFPSQDLPDYDDHDDYVPSVPEISIPSDKLNELLSDVGKMMEDSPVDAEEYNTPDQDYPDEYLAFRKEAMEYFLRVVAADLPQFLREIGRDVDLGNVTNLLIDIAGSDLPTANIRLESATLHEKMTADNLCISLGKALSAVTREGYDHAISTLINVVGQVSATIQIQLATDPDWIREMGMDQD